MDNKKEEKKVIPVSVTGIIMSIVVVLGIIGSAMIYVGLTK